MRRFTLASVVALLLLPATAALAQSTPLTLFKNYFVTGDYVVGGVGLRGLGVNGLATGTITIPDANSVPSTGVPPGADIVAAFLYWETVESSQSSFLGQRGFFNGYPITGMLRGNPNAPVSWSSGGCSGSSQGSKTIRVYRADVRPYLKLDANGKVVGNASYSVSLADSGSNGGGTPFTLGASLVLIYRVLSPTVPLNSIVLYDGAFAPSNSSSTMSLPVTGFYQAAANPVAKITHIVGNGQTNKGESVYLNAVNLPSLYPNLPPFPGYYNGDWDNPTWGSLFTGSAVNANDAGETTSVVPSATNSGCVSWGAIIFSTTVQDSDGDGLLNIWEQQQGYTDVNTGDWVALPGANPDVKDIFVEIDYLSSLGTGAGQHSHLPKQAALDAVGKAFADKGINVHFDVGGAYQGDPYVISFPPAPTGATPPPSGTGGNAIPESSIVCADSLASTPPVYCEYPGQPVISWKSGFWRLKTQSQGNSQNFWEGRKDSYHYMLFGHAIGMPVTTWSASGTVVPSTARGMLVSIVNSGTTGTVTIQTPVTNPPFQIPTNTDRVTVTGALSQFALNGTYYPINITSQTTTGNVTTTVFTITTSGVADGTYAYAPAPGVIGEPQLAVVLGGPKSTSGFSDFAGGDSLITLGLWRADDPSNCQPDPSQPLTASNPTYCNDQVGGATVQAGTLMHELGHTLSLAHGGTYYPNGTAVLGQQINNPPGLPSYGLNCKSNFLSVMNYLFQIRGFPDGEAIDYSGQTLPNLLESVLSEPAGIGSDLFTSLTAAHFTRWYGPPNAIDTKLQNTVGGRYATTHCDGTPITDGAQMVRVDGSTYSTNIDWDNNNVIDPGPLTPQDVNFNGVIGDAGFQGFNDWLNTNLSQVGARRGIGGYSTDVGGADIYGGGADIYGGGADIYGGGADIYGGGADIYGGGADIYGGGSELDFALANSTADPPSGLTAVPYPANTHYVLLTWAAPDFGQIRAYYIWRAVGSYPTLASVLANISQFSRVGSVTGNSFPLPTTFLDKNVKNKTTYTYFVTDANGFKVQSGPSTPATIAVVF